MALHDEINAIAADESLTRQERNRRVRRLKSEEFIAAVQGRLPITWSKGQGPDRVTITVTRVVLRGDDLELWIDASRRGAPIPRNNPLVIIDPRILVPSGAGEVVIEGRHTPFTQDLIRAVQTTIERTIR